MLPPATTEGGAFAIRKQVIKEMRLDDYRRMGSFDRVRPSGAGELTDLDRELCELLEANEIEAFIRLAAQSRISMLVSGGTSSGKTTFLNAVLKEVPVEERILSIEDTRELNPHQTNYLPLFASKGDQVHARVKVDSI
ncbi:MAG: ATPase, T2SS/T4P/T4SS family, partial [Methylobacterium sp.]